MAEPLTEERVAYLREAMDAGYSLFQDDDLQGLFATIDLWERRANENSDIIHKLRGELDELIALAYDWVRGRTTAVGEFSGHYPIDGPPSYAPRVEPEVVWGCNTCGEGWPCLTVRTLKVLGEEP